MKEEPLMEKVGESYTYFKEYISLKIDYLRIELAEKMGRIFSQLIMAGVVVIMITFILLLLSITAGLYLGEVLDSYPLAFLIVSGFFAVLALIIYLLRKFLITTPVITGFVRDFLDESE